MDEFSNIKEEEPEEGGLTRDKELSRFNAENRFALTKQRQSLGWFGMAFGDKEHAANAVIGSIAVGAIIILIAIAFSAKDSSALLGGSEGGAFPCYRGLGH